MKRIVEYNMSYKEFSLLRRDLDNLGYQTNGYGEMDFGTIDDGKSSGHEEAKKFSEFTWGSDVFMRNDTPIKLRVLDSDLVKAVNSHFGKKKGK